MKKFLLVLLLIFGNKIVVGQDTTSTEFVFPLHLNKTVRVSSGFGYRLHPVDKKVKLHAGIDLVASRGTLVLSSFSGIVLNAGFEKSLGHHVVVKGINGLIAIYGHLDAYCVLPGSPVMCGNLLGWVGSSGKSTGYHLHFALKKQGSFINPVGYLISSLKNN